MHWKMIQESNSSYSNTWATATSPVSQAETETLTLEWECVCSHEAKRMEEVLKAVANFKPVPPVLLFCLPHSADVNCNIFCIIRNKVTSQMEKKCFQTPWSHSHVIKSQFENHRIWKLMASERSQHFRNGWLLNFGRMAFFLDCWIVIAWLIGWLWP